MVKNIPCIPSVREQYLRVMTMNVIFGAHGTLDFATLSQSVLVLALFSSVCLHFFLADW